MNIPPALLRQCWFLAGPTASGKSAVGIELAERIGAEIVSLDSMTIYRGMDIGTAKPSQADRLRVPHHLIDIRAPDQNYSTAEYLADSLMACEAIIARGRIPLFVGGTGLYLRSLLRGVFEGPAANWEIRREWEEFARLHGGESLHAKLAAVDAPSAARLHPNDQRRVIRALEIFSLTGRSASEQLQQAPLPAKERPRHVFWLNPDRKILKDRICQRVDGMIESGFVEEVRQLLIAPEGIGQTARQALGYREILAHLDGEHTLDIAIELMKIHTQQFAKRQWTWFRNLEELTPVDIAGTESPSVVCDKLLARAVREPGDVD